MRGVIGEPLVCVVENAPGFVEAGEKKGAASAATRRRDTPRARQGERALAEMIRTEWLAADRAGEQIVTTRSGARAKASEKGRKRRSSDTEPRYGRKRTSTSYPGVRAPLSIR
jgi:hypothetical protein